MKNLKRKITEIAILLTVVSSTLPFFCHYIYADTTVPVTYNSQSTQSQWQSHLTVTNYCESPLQGSTPCKLTFTLDDNYFGMISFDGYAGNSLALSYVTVFVAGGVGEYNYRTFSNASPMYINSINIMGVGLHLPDSNIDLSDIISLLTAIESDTTALDSTTDTILIQLQSLVNQAIISNGYLQTLTKLRQWNFPIYSLTTIQNLFDRYEVIDNLSVNNYYTYPVFHVTYPTGVIVQSSDGYGDRRLIIWLDNLNDYFQNTFLTHFRLSSGWSIASYERLYQIRRKNSPYYGYILSLKIVGDGTSTNMDLYANQDTNLSVIYCGLDSNRNFDTDFALAFGLSNNLLDDLHIIAQGTQQSNTSSSELENNSSDFDDVAGDVYNLENSFNTGLNNSLQQIDTSFDVGNTFGSKFLLAADWVRVQFNTITASNPFGTLLSFSLLLGVALLIIGKVLG